MINYRRCLKFAEQYGVKPEVIENDYFVECFLHAVAGDKELGKMLIFRGGTCLHKVYFDNYRFSEDLDFVFLKGTDLPLLMGKLNSLIDGLKISLQGISVTEEKKEKSRLQIMIGYNLVNEITEGGKHLKIDICEAEDVPGNIAARIKYIYDEFKGADDSLQCYKLEAVVADKISRINSINKEARDIYDMKYLLQSDVDINEVKDEYKRRFAYNLNPEDLIRKVKDKVYEGLWNYRLGHQVKELTEYKVFIKELEVLIKERFNISDDES